MVYVPRENPAYDFKNLWLSIRTSRSALYSNLTVKQEELRERKTEAERTKSNYTERKQRSTCHFLPLSWDRPIFRTWPCCLSIAGCFYICVQSRPPLLRANIIFFPSPFPVHFCVHSCHHLLCRSSPCCSVSLDFCFFAPRPPSFLALKLRWV